MDYWQPFVKCSVDCWMSLNTWSIISYKPFYNSDLSTNSEWPSSLQSVRLLWFYSTAQEAAAENLVKERALEVPSCPTLAPPQWGSPLHLPHPTPGNPQTLRWDISGEDSSPGHAAAPPREGRVPKRTPGGPSHFRLPAPGQGLANYGLWTKSTQGLAFTVCEPRMVFTFLNRRKKF